jgi:filamentous hemagglutinin family protein
MKSRLQRRTCKEVGTGVPDRPVFRMVVPMLSLLVVQGAYALPQTGQVVAGTGTVAVAQAAGTMTVTQTSPKLVINWASFDTASGEKVNFVQQGTSSIVLNRVSGQSLTPTSFLGTLNAIGQVFVVDPRGIVFGVGSQVNVGGLVASSHAISDADFMAGTYRFSGSGASGNVINQGKITATDGGYVALIGPHVQNGGSITANSGTALLAAGDQVTLQLNGSSLLGYTIDRGTLDALAENQLSGSIRANGGKVILSAQAVNQAATAVVNNDGIIEAQTISQSGGVIQLLGDMAVGHLIQNGKLDASAPNGGKGGSIEVSAQKVKIGDSAQMTTASPAGAGNAGSFTMTANDFLVGPGGAGADLSTTVLQNTLDNNASVTITTSTAVGAGVGDIKLTLPVTWTANTTLNLIATHNVVLNDTAQSANGGKLLLRADSGGKGTGVVSLNGSAAPLMQGGQVDIYYDPANYAAPTDFTPFVAGTSTAWMLVNDLAHLQAMKTNLAGNYALGKNINASASAAMNGGTGFSPVGNVATPYSGQFDGQGNVISGLKINLIGSQDVGLFGVTSGRVANVGLEGVSIAGLTNVGAVAGTNLGTITRSYSTGAVSIPVSDPANGFAGGLVGNNAGALDKSWSSASVSGDASNIGGLVGINDHGNITESYSSGSATARGSNAGGIAGVNTVGGRISNSYSASAVDANSVAGGIAGTNEGLISFTYSSGPTSALSVAGGLVGNNKGVVGGSYSSGTTSGIFSVGLLAGVNTGTIPSDSDGRLGAAAAMQQSSYRVWDFANFWRQYDGSTLPLLRAFLTPLTLTVGASSKTYDGTPWSGQLNLNYSDPVAATSPSLHIGQPVASALPTDAGTYAINYKLAPFSDQRNGYDITVVQPGLQLATLTIDPKMIGITGMTAVDRAYDGTVNATVNGGTVQGTVGVQTLGFATVATFGDKTADINKPINVTATLQDGLGGGKASNYVVTNPVGLTATIGLRDLAVSATAANKVYDGNAADTATLASDQVKGDVLALNYGAANFTDKIAENGKTVTVTGLSIAGTDAANYRLVQPTASAKANITPRIVTVAATADDKRFDGNAAATAHVTSNNVVINDVLSAGYTQANFNDPSVGSNKAVTVTGITLSGTDAANYALQQNTAPATASITPSSPIPGLDLVVLPPILGGGGTSLAGILPGIYATAPAGSDAFNFGGWTATPLGRLGLPLVTSGAIGAPDLESGSRFDAELQTASGSAPAYEFQILVPGVRMPEGFQ